MTSDDREAFCESHLLPIVRAALARGEGPPAVVAWVRRFADPATIAGDDRASGFAHRLAAVLRDHRLYDHRRADARTEEVEQTLPASRGPGFQHG